MLSEKSLYKYFTGCYNRPYKSPGPLTYLLNTLEKTLVELWLSAEVGKDSPWEPWPAASPVRPSTHERG